MALCSHFNNSRFVVRSNTATSCSRSETQFHFTTKGVHCAYCWTVLDRLCFWMANDHNQSRVSLKKNFNYGQHIFTAFSCSLCSCRTPAKFAESNETGICDPLPHFQIYHWIKTTARMPIGFSYFAAIDEHCPTRLLMSLSTARTGSLPQVC